MRGFMRAELVKICIVGEANIGKTSLFQRYVYDKFTSHYKATIGADFLTKELVANENIYVLQLWDTPGQARFESLGLAFYKGVQAVILAYSVTDPNSVDRFAYWYDRIKDNNDQRKIPGVVVGLKMDLIAEENQTQKKAKKFADENGLLYHECSAKDLVNVNVTFQKVMESIKVFSNSKNPLLEELQQHLKGEIQKLKDEIRDLKTSNEKLAQENKNLTQWNYPEKKVAKVIKIQSFFRGAKEREKFRQEIVQKSSKLIAELMLEGKAKEGLPLLSAVAEKKWEKALQIMTQLKSSSAEKKEVLESDMKEEQNNSANTSCNN